MKILLTGTTGYIGKRLLPVLIEAGHEVVCCVRDAGRFSYEYGESARISVVEVDFLEEESLRVIPKDIDAAYFLIHSMSSSSSHFDELESTAARHFCGYMEGTSVKHVVYLSGIVNDGQLSKHLRSRKQVEDILAQGRYPFTAMRAGIILGSGSASFEIMRDLVEKLPVMIAPRWLNTRSQPIAVRNVIEYLAKVLLVEETYQRHFDIVGPEVLSYKQMLLRLAAFRQLRRWIITVPVMTPRLSSYWLYFVTSTSYSLAVNLVNSMTVEVIGKENELARVLGIKLLSFEEAIRSAFEKIEQNEIISSWKDSLVSGRIRTRLSNYITVPTHGCFKDERQIQVEEPEQVLENIWALGGTHGWYYANWLWKIRGMMDKMAGGVGLRRGRTSPRHINAGDSLDFWRVLLADKKQKRLLLFAEMKLPGEAWLEFRIDEQNVLHQTATFRPKGLLGRLYWYAVIPFHFFVFDGMLRNLATRIRPESTPHPSLLAP
ncbi:SDR family oxidoreductase [Rhabdobacter roseus]|uniref:Uncharacterized protein YbjT (DUF2867 family) n=1 Tax=Rhabdobacter roseus TaxID=1655419 RepID=A0A840TTB5_9BACT|nr:SDR family oxidoreductase [Rhabdobacter roseus]MBB5284513.1 uncharacterized protein YbjT (DUF2867 family) [Rhabdobacter roseus]